MLMGSPLAHLTPTQQIRRQKQMPLKTTINDHIKIRHIIHLILALSFCSIFHPSFLTKMKASLKGRFEPSKSSAAATLTFHAGDVKLRAAMTDATVAKGPSLNGLVLSVEKPGFFIVDYNVPNQDFKFQFMNTVKVADKPLNLTYTHIRGDNKTTLDGSLVLDSCNKFSANYLFGTENFKFKYTYVHEGLTTFEPSYDWAKNSWDFAVSKKVYDDDVLRATYQSSSKNLGLEWSRSSKYAGNLKIMASLNLAEERKVPKLSAESTWNFDM